uniref:TIL domain-containing protein n=1 Tax=Panagrolaimus sp. ES5 TaxID=591445 RepID=A0AC34F0J1_9BILA
MCENERDFIAYFCCIFNSTQQYNCGSCPQGTSCDTNTGVCRQFRPPAGGGSISRCGFVNCPYGQQCDENTGRCVVFRDPGSTNRCVCRQFRPPAIFRRLVTDKCATVQCPNGYTCDPIDGICRSRVTTTEPTNYEIFEAEQIPHPPAPSIAWRRPTQEFCPQNSEYVTCGTRCPYTCTELHPRCSTNEHNCVGACQCLDGFVQASSANVTCIPAKECPEISDKLCEGLKCPSEMICIDVCEGLKCPPEMICIDGYCNPVNCPPILKPNLERGCQYELVRDTRNCVVLKSSCEE